ncbi:MAG: winged helix-turn-helix transcriptional regulator [Anaerolineales bacterium]|nr:MAG: winged helix-turn-helix transcriptional regulator [Anaerolineales bacterium]
MSEKKTTIASEVLETIPMVMRIIRRNFRARRDPDLSLPEFRALAYINRNPGCALNELAEFVGVEAPAASKLVESLVQRGLAKREAHAGDRRRVQLSVLPKGQKSIQIVREHTREFLTEQLAHLSSKEQEAVVEAMHILKDAFASPSAAAGNEPKKE